MLWRIRRIWLLWRWQRRTGTSEQEFMEVDRFVRDVAAMTPRDQVLVASFYVRHWTARGMSEEEAASGAQALLSAVRKLNGGAEM